MNLKEKIDEVKRYLKKNTRACSTIHIQDDGVVYCVFCAFDDLSIDLFHVYDLQRGVSLKNALDKAVARKTHKSLNLVDFMIWHDKPGRKLKDFLEVMELAKNYL